MKSTFKAKFGLVGNDEIILQKSEKNAILNLNSLCYNFALNIKILLASIFSTQGRKNVFRISLSSLSNANLAMVQIIKRYKIMTQLLNIFSSFFKFNTFKSSKFRCFNLELFKKCSFIFFKFRLFKNNNFKFSKIKSLKFFTKNIFKKSPNLKHDNELKSPFLATLPVMMGYIPLGAAYAILAASNGLDLWDVLLISLVVYAGAGQFVLIALIAADAGLFEIFITLFALNFRHFFYTLSLLGELKQMNFLKHYSIFALTDESFALISAEKKAYESLSLGEKSRRVFMICFLNQAYWLLGSLLGFLFQRGVSVDYSGVEFSLNALFIVLFYELFKQNPSKKIFIFSSIISIFALIFIDKSLMIVFCLVLGLLFLFWGKNYVK